MNRAFDANGHPDRLNLGCGWDIREGYLNVDVHDFHGPDLVADVTQLDMLPAGHYQEILAQDVLEHLPRQRTVEILRGWSRLLRIGGRIHLRVPSVIDLAELLKRPENQTVSEQELLVQCLFGTEAYTEDCHYTTFTEPLLRHYLAEADLDPTKWNMRDEWLFEVDAVKLEPGMPDGGGKVRTVAPIDAPPVSGQLPHPAGESRNAVRNSTLIDRLRIRRRGA